MKLRIILQRQRSIKSVRASQACTADYISKASSKFRGPTPIQVHILTIQAEEASLAWLADTYIFTWTWKCQKRGQTYQRRQRWGSCRPRRWPETARLRGARWTHEPTHQRGCPRWAPCHRRILMLHTSTNLATPGTSHPPAYQTPPPAVSSWCHENTREIEKVHWFLHPHHARKWIESLDEWGPR